GLYPIIEIAGSHSYSIDAGENATSTVSGGGAVPAFTTSSSSATVSVALAGHGLQAGVSRVDFALATSVGGISVVGEYLVNTVTDADHFTVTASQSASSTDTEAMNSGNAEAVYYINLGPAPTGTGFGVGAFGVGG